MEDVDHHKYHHDAGCSVVARGGVQSKAGCGGCHPADLKPDEEVGDKAGRDCDEDIQGHDVGQDLAPRAPHVRDTPSKREYKS